MKKLDYVKPETEIVEVENAKDVGTANYITRSDGRWSPDGGETWY